ncbi:MAG: hypothetical protein R3F62_18515 [Planctomycetota bacterium]
MLLELLLDHELGFVGEEPRRGREVQDPRLLGRAQVAADQDHLEHRLHPLPPLGEELGVVFAALAVVGERGLGLAQLALEELDERLVLGAADLLQPRHALAERRVEVGEGAPAGQAQELVEVGVLDLVGDPQELVVARLVLSHGAPWPA